MELKRLFNDYLLSIKLQHSKGTFRHYDCHIKHFLKWADIQQISDVSDVSDNIIVDYITDMKETCAPITINKRIGILKRCFRAMNIKHDYLQSVPKFKETVKTYDMIDERDLKRIRRHVLNLPDAVGNNLYYKAMVLLFMDTGARASEILLIEKKCVDLDKCEIRLTHTKTKEDRIVYIQPTSINVIKKMLAVESKHKYLLHNIMKDRPAVYDDTVVVMKKIKEALDIDKLHPHMFRHSLATIWLQSGADIKSVMIVMGHRNIETTERYLHSNKDHVKNQYKLFDLD